MTLLLPFCISARLMAAVKIDNAFISIEYAPRPGDHGRTRYRYYIDLPNGVEHTNDDLQSGMFNTGLQQGMISLLDFMEACGESFGYNMHLGRREAGYHSDTADLFPPAIAEWCYQHSDELGMLRFEIEERPGELVIE